MTSPELNGIDIGAPQLAGSTRQAGGRVEMTAAGRDIWNRRDEFHFACRPVRGDFDLSARIEALSMADLYTKAGLMLRASPEAGAPHVYLLAFGDNEARNKNNGGIEFQYRKLHDDLSFGVYPPQPLSDPPDFPVFFPDVWLRLTRRGSHLIARASRDGRTWRTFCEHETDLPESALLGLALTSHHEDRTVRCVFAEISCTGETGAASAD